MSTRGAPPRWVAARISRYAADDVMWSQSGCPVRARYCITTSRATRLFPTNSFSRVNGSFINDFIRSSRERGGRHRRQRGLAGANQLLHDAPVERIVDVEPLVALGEERHQHLTRDAAA